MFGSTAKPAFSFGGSSATNNNNSTPSSGLQFGTKPNIFGNSQSTGQTTSNALAAPGTTSTGFSFGNNSGTNTNSAPANGFSLGNNTSTAGTPTGLFGNNNLAASNSGSTGMLGANSTAKPTNGLFGNNNSTTASSNLVGNTQPSNTSSLFNNNNIQPGNTSTINSLFSNNNNNNNNNNNGNSSNPQQTNFTSNPYGINLSGASGSLAEMPSALTPRRTNEKSLKHKRSTSSTSSHDSASISSSSALPAKGGLSFLNRISNTFKSASSNKYSLESVTGIFSTAKPTLETNNSSSTTFAANGFNNTSKLVSYSGVAPGAPKSEYRRLVVRHPSGAFKNYQDINADSVILKKRKLISSSGATSASIASFKPRLEPKKPVAETDLPVQDKEKKSKISSESKEDLVNHPEGYWCSPSLSYLSKLTSEDLAHVENFTVGRLGIGQVLFNYPVDLTAFQNNWEQLLGKCIEFHHRLLEVYSHKDFVKPSPGNGLNVPSTISLEKCFPIDKETKNPITDPSAPETIELLKRLKSLVGMEFVNYELATGTFTFQVDHFSIWGLIDEENDDPELVERYKKQIDFEIVNQKRKNEMKTNALEKMSKYRGGKELFESDTSYNEDSNLLYKRQKGIYRSAVPGGWGFQSTGFDDDEQVTPNSSESDDSLEDDEVQLEEPASDDDDDGSDSDYGSDAFVDVESDFNEVVHMKAYEPEIGATDIDAIKTQTEFPTSNNWEEQIDLSNGFYSIFNSDLNAAKNMKLDAKNINEYLFDEEDGSRFKKPEQPTIIFDNVEHYNTLLADEISRSTKIPRHSNGFPLVDFDHAVSLATTLSVFKNTTDFNIWDLIARFYDNEYCLTFLSDIDLRYCETHSHLKAKFLDVKRRELLVQWLHDYNSQEIERLLRINELDNLERIYILACSGDLTKAVYKAVDSSNNHLSVLLTLADSNDQSVRELANKQLKEWQANSSLKLIPEAVLKVYKLLSGDILSKKFVPHLNGLSWSIVLLLVLKYGDSNKSLDELISDFLKYQDGLDQKPNTTDSIYPIIKFFNDPSKMLSNFTVEFQFMLVKKLKSVLQISSLVSDSILLEFSEKLNHFKSFKESVFVLEHLADDDICKSEITKVVNENVDALRFLEDHYNLKSLHDDLKLPLPLLFEARANKFEEVGQDFKAAVSLISAGLLSRSHKLTLEKVAPSFIISNSRLDQLEELLLEFDTLPNWSIGGELYYSYLMVLKIVSADKETSNSELEGYLRKLVNGLQLLEDVNFKVKVVKTLMYKKVLRLIFENGFEYNAQQLLSLNLPDSEANYLKIRLPRAVIES